MIYAKVRNLDDTIVETRHLESFDAAAVAHKFGADKEYRIIPINRQADPAYDPATHRLGPDVLTVLAGEAQVTRTVEPLPQAEIDATSEREQAKLIYQTLKDGNATNLQVQRILARLIRDQYGE